MKDKTQILLEQYYDLVNLKQTLLREGYSSEEIDQYLIENIVLNSIKKAAQKISQVTRKTVPSLAIAASMLLGASGQATAAPQTPMSAETKAALEQIYSSTQREVETALGASKKKFNETLQNIAKETAVDMQKIDAIEAQLIQLKNHANPDVARYMWPTIAAKITGITANGKITGAKDYNKQQEIIKQIEPLLKGEWKGLDKWQQSKAINDYIDNFMAKLN